MSEHYSCQLKLKAVLSMKIPVVVLIVAILVATFSVPDVDAADCNQRSCTRACQRGTRSIQVSTCSNER